MKNSRSPDSAPENLRTRKRPEITLPDRALVGLLRNCNKKGANIMEKNTVNQTAGTMVSGGENLYPNLPHPPVMEAEKRLPYEQFAKPGLISKIAPASLLYAIFFTFCLYKNASGITYPFYVAGTIGFAVYTIRKFGISWKGEHISILAASLLLGISNCFTDNSKIILMNEAWLFVLMMYFLLAVCFDTEKWQIGKFVGNMAGLVLKSIGKMFSFFLDAQAWQKEHKGAKKSQTLYVLAGAAISVPLIAVVLLLLSTADVIFRESLDMIFGDINGWDVFCCIILSVFMFFFSYGMVSLLEGRELNDTVKDHRTGQPVIAISATAVIALIYVYFCGIQIVYLFAGYGTLPEGYSYAYYARQGFFQLLFICLMNLGLVLIGLGFFRESKALKGILLVISFCTFIMIASSAYRMLLYISVYYLTFLRIFVLWALVVIALLMAGVVGKTLYNTFPLFRYGLAVVTCCYLILSFGRPDYWIARYNISSYMTQTKEQEEEGVRLDTWYLSGLSADAAPVIMSKNNIEQYYEYEAQKEKMLKGEIKSIDTPEWQVSYILLKEGRVNNMSFRSYNFSRGYVKKALEKK